MKRPLPTWVRNALFFLIGFVLADVVLRLAGVPGDIAIAAALVNGTVWQFGMGET